MRAKILLFAHDPGGANTIIPLVNPLKASGYNVVLYGKNYALTRYANFGLRGINIESKIKNNTMNSLKKFLQEIKPDFIITGTSAADMTERHIWHVGTKINIPSFAILDLWVNYRNRFSKYGAKYTNNPKDFAFLPTKICVMDRLAKNEAIKEGLDEKKIIITGQPYFEYLFKYPKMASKRLNYIRKSLNVNPNDFLIIYASEPITGTYTKKNNSENYQGFTEKTIFNNLYTSLKKYSNSSKEINIRLLIKLHPRERSDNYDSLIKNLPKSPRLVVDVFNNQKIST